MATQQDDKTKKDGATTGSNQTTAVGGAPGAPRATPTPSSSTTPTPSSNPPAADAEKANETEAAKGPESAAEFQAEGVLSGEARQMAIEMGRAIREGVAEAMGTSRGVGSIDSSQPETEPEMRLDYAPNGGVFKLNEDPDAPFVNSWGERCDEEGYAVEERKPVSRRKPPRRPVDTASL